jgi:hypothetical protein
VYSSGHLQWPTRQLEALVEGRRARAVVRRQRRRAVVRMLRASKQTLASLIGLTPASG